MSKRKGKKESGRTPLLASFPSDESSPRSSASKRDLFEPCRPKTIDLGEKVIKAREGGQQREIAGRERCETRRLSRLPKTHEVSRPFHLSSVEVSTKLMVIMCILRMSAEKNGRKRTGNNEPSIPADVKGILIRRKGRTVEESVGVRDTESSSGASLSEGFGSVRESLREEERERMEEDAFESARAIFSWSRD